MNPHQKNKVDVSSLSPDEQRLFRLYGKLPNKKDLLQKKLEERKYFDSGDYALSKAGKASDAGVTQVGREHPQPENIPHLTTSSPHASMSSPPASANGNMSSPTPNPAPIQSHGMPSGSPVKDSSILHREESIDDQPGTDKQGSAEKGGEKDELEAGNVSPTRHREGMPIRGSGI